MKLRDCGMIWEHSQFSISLSDELQELFEPAVADLEDREDTEDIIAGNPVITEAANIFLTMRDWRSFNLTIMDKACVPGGIWDKIVKEYEESKTDRIINPLRYQIAALALMGLDDQSTVAYKALRQL
jgi:hypothetical protein